MNFCTDLRPNFPWLKAFGFYSSVDQWQRALKFQKSMPSIQHGQYCALPEAALNGGDSQHSMYQRHISFRTSMLKALTPPTLLQEWCGMTHPKMNDRILEANTVQDQSWSSHQSYYHKVMPWSHATSFLGDGESQCFAHWCAEWDVSFVHYVEVKL